MKANLIKIALLAAVVSTGAAQAMDKPVVQERFSGTNVTFELNGAYDSYLLTVSGPNDFFARSYSETAVPEISLRQVTGRALMPADDGIYRYRLSTAPAAGAEKGHVIYGAFRVEGGQIVPFQQEQPE